MKAKISMQQKKSNTMMLMKKIHGGVGKANSKDELKNEASNDDGDPEGENGDNLQTTCIYIYTPK